MKIGIVVATSAEKEPFLEIFGKTAYCYTETGYKVERWILNYSTDIFLIKSGFGEIAATSATQYLIDHFGVDKIINYGAVGSLTDKYRVGDAGIVEKVVHYGFDLSVDSKYVVGEYPEKGLFLKPTTAALSIGLTTLEEQDLAIFTCASADKFVGAGGPKKWLGQCYDADICDMESAGILITCNKNKVPVTFIKAVSDGVEEDMEAFDKNVYSVSRRCVEIIKKLIE